MPLVPELTSYRPALKRIGHKGADALAPGNTPASFEAARGAGVDVIEFDVLRLRDGRIVLAHDLDDAARRDPLSLDEGLDHLAGEAYAGLDLDVDLKVPGYEREVVEGLRARGLVERSLVSSMFPQTVDLIGACAATTPSVAGRSPPSSARAFCGPACRPRPPRCSPPGAARR